MHTGNLLTNFLIEIDGLPSTWVMHYLTVLITRLKIKNEIN